MYIYIDLHDPITIYDAYFLQVYLSPSRLFIFYNSNTTNYVWPYIITYK